MIVGAKNFQGEPIRLRSLHQSQSAHLYHQTKKNLDGNMDQFSIGDKYGPNKLRIDVIHFFKGAIPDKETKWM
jgi:hypothetical protein